ncbi:MAG TPA: PAS domain S-box protein, partial [Thermodesulfobacteriota bacterium]|nr:PAS domain S-box protein [Thermodesulfobacteriota bacterium]
MTTKIGNNLTLKWMVLLTLSTILPLIIVGLSIIVIYRQDLRASFIAVEGIVLIAGILFSFFSARKLILPFQGPGNTVGYEGLVKDISDRERIEEDVIKSEERYRSVLENIQDGYFEIDLAGNYTFVNDAECINLGYTREELIGMNNRQYTEKESAKKVFETFNQVYKTGEPLKGLVYE